MKLLKNISIKIKIIISGCVIILCFATGIFGYLIPLMQESVIEKKKEKIKEITDIALSIVKKNYDEYQEGNLSLEEAQSKSIFLIKNMRYGPENKDYLWINDFHPNMIMHPYRSDLDGTDISDFKDPNGKLLFVEFVRTCSRQENGYVDYMWQWKDDSERIVPKISYVASFNPWGWIIGTGIYIEDVLEEFQSVKIKTMLLFSLIIAATAILMFISSHAISKYMTSVGSTLKDIAEQGGDLTYQLKVESRDEIGKFSSNFNKFILRIREVIQEVKKVSSQLSDSSKSLLGTSITFADNAQNQATYVEEITATTEQISAGMDSVFNAIDEQYQKITFLRDHIELLTGIINNLGTEIRKSTNTMEHITAHARTGEEALREMNTSIAKINDSSTVMRNVFTIINDISDQVHLLSLNASIEAARAGTAGRGFAVVAQEISKLSDQTAKSIREIDNLIKANNAEIVKGIAISNTTVDTMTNIISSIDEISLMMNAIFSSIEDQLNASSLVTQQAESVKRISDEISRTTEEQRIAVSEISKSITGINDLAQQYAAGAVNMSSDSKNITQVITILMQNVNFFKV